MEKLETLIQKASIHEWNFEPIVSTVTNQPPTQGQSITTTMVALEFANPEDAQDFIAAVQAVKA